MKDRPSIEQLERLMDDGEGIEILPNGEVRRQKGKRRPRKPLTFRKQLGGEYGIAA